MPFADHLHAEIARLEAQLEADPAYQLLQTLKKAAALSGAVYGSSAAKAAAEADGGEAGKRPTGRRQSPERQAALDAIEKLLAGRVEPTKTATLLEYLVERRIEIGGADPQNNLSALLAYSERFQSHGRRGWTLKAEDQVVEEEEEEEDDLLGTPSSSSAAADEDDWSFEDEDDLPPTRPPYRKEAPF